MPTFPLENELCTRITELPVEYEGAAERKIVV